MNIELKYKMVSFDIWGTLICSNPIFAELRTHLFAELFQINDLVKIRAIKDEVDIEKDNLSESTGIDFNFNARIIAMLEKLQKSPQDYPNDFLELFRIKLNNLFIANPPRFINEETVNLFQELKKRNIKIALLSNTGFLHGDAMRVVLKGLGISKYIDYTIFSNEIGFAKPHQNIYNALLNQAGLSATEVIHIGDSVKADYLGGAKSGLHSILLDCNYKYGNRMFSIQDITAVLGIVDANTPILHYNNFSLSNLHLDNNVILDQKKEVFDSISYSKFKYGDGYIARQYGKELAQKFIETHSHLFGVNYDTSNLIITTTPYKAVVKGASGIVTGFKNHLNHYLIALKKPSIVDIMILKKEMFQGEYGSFNEEQRKTIMNKSELYISEKLILNKILIVIDDIRITGQSEANMVSFLVDKRINKVYFLYIADMETSLAKKCPDIENIINHGWVNDDDYDKLLKIMKSPEFILNARVCKHVLSPGNPILLEDFLKKLEDHILYKLYNGIVGDGYNTMKLYESSFEILRSEFERRDL